MDIRTALHKLLKGLISANIPFVVLLDNTFSAGIRDEIFQTLTDVNPEEISGSQGTVIVTALGDTPVLSTDNFAPITMQGLSNANFCESIRTKFSDDFDMEDKELKQVAEWAGPSPSVLMTLIAGAEKGVCIKYHLLVFGDKLSPSVN